MDNNGEDVLEPAERLRQLREQIDGLNRTILLRLSERARLVMEVHKIKKAENIPLFIPEREQEMLLRMMELNEGPFANKTVRHLFKEIFRASLDLMETETTQTLKISRTKDTKDLEIILPHGKIGGSPVIIAGPCAVEGEKQLKAVAQHISSKGVKIIRGGAFKPRSSPYSFQGMGKEALKLLRDVGNEFGLSTVSEVMDTRTVDLVSSYVDILQVGARNMYNYELLREVGRSGKPVLLKRGLSATIEEFLLSAEYIASAGNQHIILCERGIRTFERETRNTLDISAIPLLKNKSFLPVIVDVSHAAGRRDILAPLSRAALAAGADGIMLEVHPTPDIARSDSQQQLSLEAFDAFLTELEALSTSVLIRSDG